MFNFKHIFTPIAIILSYRARVADKVYFREMFVFGVRIAYWTVAEKDAV